MGVNCYLAHNLHNQQLSKSLLQGFGTNKCCNDATITAKPCLTIIVKQGFAVIVASLQHLFVPKPCNNDWVLIAC